MESVTGTPLDFWWPILSGMVLMPFTQWLKNLIPEGWPFRAVQLTTVLSIVIALVANSLLGWNLSDAQVVTFVMATIGSSSIVNGIAKKAVARNPKLSIFGKKGTDWRGRPA